MSESDSEIEEKEIEWERRVSEMRERLKTRLDENTIEGKRENNLYHGMKLVSSITMIGKYKEICYCEETQEYLVIDSPSNMLRYSVEAKLIQPSYSLSANMLFTKLLWCQRAKVLIGYLPNDDVIWLMTSFCMLYQVFRNEFRITSVFYEPDTNEAIVAGPNKLTRFSLTNKESTINPWKTMSYIDSEYGTLWKLECLSLIPSSTFLNLLLIHSDPNFQYLPYHESRKKNLINKPYIAILRMAGSYMTTLYVLPLETSKEKEEAVPIMFLARNPGATEAQITALHFQIDSQWIITGDDQGNVKGWNLELNCMMSCPGGHSKCVKRIAPHPSICGFITCAEDNVLQIWSCNLRGKMESFSNVGEIWGIAVNESAAAIATLGQKLCCFNMHQLYTFYAALSESATEIISTMNPMYPTRVIVRSFDNSIRILTSSTGKQISLQILPKSLNLVSMAYSGNRDRLYTIILKTGEILVSNSKMNPMELKHVWVPERSVITCLTAYEYYEEIRGYDLKPQKPRVIHPKCTLIFVGTEDGAIINIDESSGEHEGKFMAHKGAVLKLWSSTISKLVVSTGIDKCVKVWRVYANLGVPLALAYSVYYTVPITHIITMGSVICMASSTPRMLVHQLFMYDMVERVRLDHHQSKDHTKLIVAIAASESLQICATSSMDNTIRLWDQQNNPIKVLEINTCARNIVFSSLRGDIVFGAGRHLYRILYCNYLAPKYRARIILNEIPDEIEDEMLPENEEYRIYENEVDREFLLHPVSSAPLGSLDIKDGDAPRMELMIQQQKCAQLQRRDQDVESIKKGEIQTVKLVADKSLMNREAWEKYLEDISGASNKPGTEIPAQDVWAMIEKFKNVKRFYNKPGIFKMLYGYSIEKFTQYPETLPESVQHPRIPLFGFLPNSVIYKLFNDEEDLEPPPPNPEPKPLLKYEYPKEFLIAQLRGTSSSRLDSRIEFSPSQLINMTYIKDVESDMIVVRADIEENSPFIRIATQRAQNQRKKRHKALQYCNVKGKSSSVTKTPTRRQQESADFEIPWTIEKIIHGNESKFETIISRKIASGKSLFNLGAVTEKKSGIKKSRKARRLKISVIRLKRNPKVPACNLNRISKETLQLGTEAMVMNIDDLTKMKIQKLIAQKESVKKILRQDYGSISKAHDNKIKEALMTLLGRCMNSPSSFSTILNLLYVLSIDDIETIGFLCAVFAVTSKNGIRRSVIKYLKNRGLEDPRKVLTRQLLVVKSLTNINEVSIVTKFISGMISDWMKTLERHVSLVSENLRSSSEDLKCAKGFLRKDASSFSSSFSNNFNTVDSNFNQKLDDSEKGIQRIHQGSKSELVVSPIEGINYFCELNTRFSNLLKKK